MLQRVWSKGSPPTALVGIRAGAAAVETCMEAPQKLKIELPDDLSSLVAQLVKSLPPMQETRVRSRGREDPLEKGMATHSSILAWRSPWTEEPGGLQSIASQVLGTT